MRIALIRRKMEAINFTDGEGCKVGIDLGSGINVIASAAKQSLFSAEIASSLTLLAMTVSY
jgi:hypothetical protein